MIPSAFVSFVIAIDGPAAAGKDQTVQFLLRFLKGFKTIDTGAFYRAVATIWKGSAKVLSRITTSADGQPLIDGRPIKSASLHAADMGLKTSKVSKISAVRKHVNEIFRKLAADKKMIFVGRDMGTVVFPKAALKVYMTASPLIRAKRALKDTKRGYPKRTPWQRVLADVLMRDHHDMNRKTAPLRPAKDAIILDTDTMTAQQAAGVIYYLYQNVLAEAAA